MNQRREKDIINHKPPADKPATQDVPPPPEDRQLQKAVEYLPSNWPKPARKPTEPRRRAGVGTARRRRDDHPDPRDHLRRDGGGRGHGPAGRCWASVVASQDKLHERFRGVVPEIAARAHVERILPVIDEALRRAGVGLADLDAIAVANTPGLAGSLLVGLVAAKTLASGAGQTAGRREPLARPHLRLPDRQRPRGVSLRGPDRQRRPQQPVSLPQSVRIRALGRHDRRRRGRGVRQGGQHAGPALSRRAGDLAGRRSPGIPGPIVFRGRC